MTDKSLPLLGKIAIVTGASRGIGAGITLRLAQDGAHLILAFTSSSSEPKAAALASQIEALPHRPRAHTIQADLSTLTGPQHLIDAAVAWKQQHLPNAKISILINNAATEVVASLATLTSADYSKCFDTNVRGPILVTQALLPHLPPRARIINLSSVGARAGFKDMSLYSSSKAALEGLTRSWAAELGGNGTTVNAWKVGG